MEENPDKRQRTDFENIRFSVIAAELQGLHISHEAARTIAAQFDAGAKSDMHSFVTTGRIGDRLEDEIEANIRETSDPDDQNALAYLAAYAMQREDKSAQERWSELWLVAPREYEDDRDDRCNGCGEHISSPHGIDCPLDPDYAEEG